MTNIAICGYPRSGTTLLYNMIRASCVSHRTFDREVSAAGLREPGPWITKDPSDRRYRDLDVERVIMVRDPRDVLCSIHATNADCYKVSWDYTLSGKTGQEKLRREGLVEIDAQCRAIDGLVVAYEALCRQPEAVQERLRRALGLVFSGRFADVHRHEPAPGLTKQLNGVRAVETSRIGRWRGHPKRIRAQFAAAPALHDILITRGYEEDRSWIERL